MKPKETSEHYILSSSPHAHANVSVSHIMLDVLIALARYYKTSADYLLGLTDERKPYPDSKKR